MATYVIVHGAWGGGWSWNRRIAAPLRSAGHEVFTPTLTGLGERTHLAAPTVDLDVHIQDVVSVLEYEDVRDAILVGHSYGGMVITGVAARASDRLRHLVYLDAFVPETGQSLLDLIGPEGATRVRAQAEAAGDGWRIPPGPLAPDTPADLIDWITPRRGEQPLRTFEQAVRMDSPIALPRTYVYCATKTGYDTFRGIAQRLRNDPAWQFRELQTGHNLQYSATTETVRLLLEHA
jgi:pimeloyl-ACP methyl ester carboxylesterase